MARSRKRQIFKKRKFHSGITLPELLVTVFLFLFISGALYASFSVGQDSWDVNKAQITLQAELRKAAERIKYDLMQAGPSPLESIDFDENQNECVAFSSIVFHKREVNEDDEIQWGEEISFILDAEEKQIQRIQGDTIQIIAQNIQLVSFAFKCTVDPQEGSLLIERKIVEVKLVGEETKIKRDINDRQFSFQIHLRN